MSTNLTKPKPLTVGAAPFHGARVRIRDAEDDIESTWTPNADGIYVCDCCGKPLNDSMRLLDLEVTEIA